ELRLKSEKETKVLAHAAADVIKRHLLMEGPFVFGIPCDTGKPDDVAEDVVSTVPKPNYPVIVSPDNEWSKAAITAQVATAFKNAEKDLRVPIENLKT